jgi:CDP-diacylglycerol--glycerol-3-phosphate 3-phosphatidyltransferase
LVQSAPTVLMSLVAAVIIGREITVSALREWMSEQGERAQVSVTDFAKWKTTLQIFGISFMLYEEPHFGWPVYDVGLVLLLVAVVLTLWSMVDYLRAAWPVLRGGG